MQDTHLEEFVDELTLQLDELLVAQVFVSVSLWGVKQVRQLVLLVQVLHPTQALQVLLSR